MTFEEYMDAAALLRKYSQAVETHLFMDMKIDEAHREIELAEKLAQLLEDAAARVDTLIPEEPQQ
jgi:histone acetyltransferase (RNA polymerase elongator complex component)